MASIQMLNIPIKFGSLPQEYDFYGCISSATSLEVRIMTIVNKPCDFICYYFRFLKPFKLLMSEFLAGKYPALTVQP